VIANSQHGTMVGVAGKSKACHDCRRRRVKVRKRYQNLARSLAEQITSKCDFRKPGCLRCEKAGTKCFGYKRDSIFVNRTFHQPFTTASNIRQDEREKRMQAALESISPCGSLLRLLLYCRDPTYAPCELRAQAWAILKDLYLPKTIMAHDVRIGSTTPYSWLQAACELRGESKVLDQSLLAFCAIQVHISIGATSPDLGLQLYNDALEKLSEGLEASTKRATHDCLAAIVVLSTCEVCSFPIQEREYDTN
jgi:hypothetical protein